MVVRLAQLAGPREVQGHLVLKDRQVADGPVERADPVLVGDDRRGLAETLARGVAREAGGHRLLRRRLVPAQELEDLQPAVEIVEQLRVGESARRHRRAAAGRRTRYRAGAS